MYEKYVKRSRKRAASSSSPREFLSSHLAAMGLENTVSHNALPSKGSGGDDDRPISLGLAGEDGDILTVDVAHTTGRRIAFLTTSQCDCVYDPRRRIVTLNGRNKCKDRMMEGLGWTVVRVPEEKVLGSVGEGEEIRDLLEEKLEDAGIKLSGGLVSVLSSAFNWRGGRDI